jgi:hypothetical protein
MQRLTQSQTAAIMRLTPKRRIEWSIAGGHVARGLRGGWKAVMSERAIAEAAAELKRIVKRNTKKQRKLKLFQDGVRKPPRHWRFRAD